MAKDLTNKIISLCKRKGFIFPSSEIYGGFKGVYDFGPLGLELKENIKENWRRNMKEVEGIVPFDSGILMNPKIWQASGHLSAGFADELVECKKCHKRFRIDELKKNFCPQCGGEVTDPRNFNLMMKTFIGPVEDENNISYFRPETCQGIFINFLNILNSQRLKLPFGVIQIGKSFRNEVNPKNYIFRTREFEQMEMEWFCSPKEADKWFDFWLERRLKWYEKMGISKDKIKAREVSEEEKAHYARRQIDIEYHFPFGWKEIEGIHNRGDWDLKNHSKHSGEELKYEDYYPYIIETSIGVERSLFAFLHEFYEEVEGGRTKTTKSVKESEVLLRFPKELAPIKIAVLPLLKNKEKLVGKAEEVYNFLKPYFEVQYDEKGSIGRRYRRQDEIGTLFTLTIDFESLNNNDLTVRDRDTMKQERVEIKNLKSYLENKLK